MSAGADAAATAGFLADSASGNAQFQNIFAKGGTFEGVTIELRKLYDVQDGLIDLNGDGLFDGNDDGTFFGIAVINGELDFDGEFDAGADHRDPPVDTHAPRLLITVSQAECLLLATRELNIAVAMHADYA